MRRRSASRRGKRAGCKFREELHDFKGIFRDISSEKLIISKGVNFLARKYTNRVVPQCSDDVKSVAAEGEREKKEEDEEVEEDVHGTKKLRSDFHGMMGSLEEEMEAGKSKLAKLREKIRKARGAIKAADEAMKAEEEERRQKKS